jgi:hypothetical protein
VFDTCNSQGHVEPGINVGKQLWPQLLQTNHPLDLEYQWSNELKSQPNCGSVP